MSIDHDAAMRAEFSRWYAQEFASGSESTARYRATKVIDLMLEAWQEATRRASAREATDKSDANQWRELLAEVMTEMPKMAPSAGNAPFHGHSVPGIWDRDNGAKAGKPCVWCKVWNAARIALAAAAPEEKEKP